MTGETPLERVQRWDREWRASPAWFQAVVWLATLLVCAVLWLATGPAPPVVPL